jgi:isoamylase
VHDGITLTDLVSYNGKHNEANTEDNRDGTDDNRSWNCGVEGATTDSDVLALRARQKRALLLTLLLSAGVPLLLGGDELGRTQRGNNNAYCQDNEITWFDWSTLTTNSSSSQRTSSRCAVGTRCSAGTASRPASPPRIYAGSPWPAPR